MGGVDDLVLDPRIRDWVLLPIVVVMVLIGICRTMAQRMMASQAKQDIEQVKQQNTLMRSQRLRQNGGFIPLQSMLKRKAYFSAKKTKDANNKSIKGTGGILCQKQKGANPAAAMQNPSGMMNMMKNNMSFMIPNVLMMAWINYFFDGFLIVKVPFPLTPRFKMMLQQGIDLKSLSASYVSSLSWYFIVMFGINGFYSLILGQKVDAGEEMMKAQMGMMGGGPQQFDAKKAFIGERDAVRMMQHVDVAAFSERTLVGMDTDVLGDGHSHGGKPCSSTHGKKGIEAAGGKSGKSGEKAGLRQRKGKTAA